MGSAAGDAIESSEVLDEGDAEEAAFGSEEVQMKSSDWLKQRLACELLGDSVRAPWEIDEEEIFSRLASLLQSATATDAMPRQLALHHLLLSMQRTVQANAEEVRNFLEVQLISNEGTL